MNAIKQMREPVGPAFVLEGDKEYLAARLLLNAGISISSKGTYHAATALEQILKAFFFFLLSQDPTNDHDLAKLARACSAGNDPYFSEKKTLTDLDSFTPYQQLGRYGANASARSDPGSKVTPNFQIRGVMIYDPNFLDKLDEHYLTVRSKIHTLTVDGLGAIKAGAADHLFVAQWHLPIKPLEVLSAGNKYMELIK